ncbi:hypothetical protein BMS3Bbin06_00997 [bacterium BMS3Bbin06]|nr:hypothetical protein BMS3Bbin06_00997 [bacterium BMS3Bbin06]
MTVQKTRLKIGGMMCSFCSQTIEKALRRTRGDRFGEVVLEQIRGSLCAPVRHSRHSGT